MQNSVIQSRSAIRVIVSVFLGMCFAETIFARQAPFEEQIAIEKEIAQVRELRSAIQNERHRRLDGNPEESFDEVSLLRSVFQPDQVPLRLSVQSFENLDERIKELERQEFELQAKLVKRIAQPEIEAFTDPVELKKFVLSESTHEKVQLHFFFGFNWDLNPYQDEARLRREIEKSLEMIERTDSEAKHVFVPINGTTDFAGGDSFVEILSSILNQRRRHILKMSPYSVFLAPNISHYVRPDARSGERVVPGMDAYYVMNYTGMDRRAASIAMALADVTTKITAHVFGGTNEVVEEVLNLGSRCANDPSLQGKFEWLHLVTGFKLAHDYGIDASTKLRQLARGERSHQLRDAVDAKSIRRYLTWKAVANSKSMKVILGWKDSAAGGIASLLKKLRLMREQNLEEIRDVAIVANAESPEAVTKAWNPWRRFRAFANLKNLDDLLSRTSAMRRLHVGLKDFSSRAAVRTVEIVNTGKGELEILLGKFKSTVATGRKSKLRCSEIFETTAE